MPQPSFDVRWSTLGFHVHDAVLARDGRLILFGREGGAPVAALGADENGLGPAVRVPLRGFAYTAATAPDGTLWVGGRANQRAYVPGGDISDIYLAHIDRDGRLLAEYRFGKGWFRGCYRTVRALAVLSSGEVVAVARDGGKTWLAKITTAGALAWETRFGIYKTACVAVLPDDRIAIASFDSVGSQKDRTYSEGVTVRVFDRTGHRLAETNIRKDLNTAPGANSEQLATAAVESAVYVASSWTCFPTRKAIEVAKVGVDGAVLWRRLLDDPIIPGQTGSDGSRLRSTCRPSLTVLPNGDALLARVEGNRIALCKLAAANGEVALTDVPLPTYGRGCSAELFLFANKGGSLWVLGSGSAHSAAEGCTWLGHIDHLAHG